MTGANRGAKSKNDVRHPSQAKAPKPAPQTKQERTRGTEQPE